ncbi:MAG: hypothetical protein KIT72_08320 [Polyangiaceae bacterium]|nr:hypothetical protein [Polyangiaceae bacterium]MCW5790412.1 hypothetical protein [Polyangiaceae bacterium]
MARIPRDTSDWPIVYVTWPSRPIDDDDVELFLKESLEELERGTHVSIHLSEGGSGLRAKQRRRVAEWMLEHHELIGQRILGAAVVVRNPVLRAMVTAVNWMAPPPYPQHLFAEQHEARAWVEGQLTAAGIPLPTRQRSASPR